MLLILRDFLFSFLQPSDWQDFTVSNNFLFWTGIYLCFSIFRFRIWENNTEKIIHILKSVGFKTYKIPLIFCATSTSKNFPLPYSISWLAWRGKRRTRANIAACQSFILKQISVSKGVKYRLNLALWARAFISVIGQSRKVWPAAISNHLFPAQKQKCNKTT